MSRPTGRVLTLLELLQSGGVRTMAELADRLGVDPRTVRRYVDHLVDLDVPVEAVRGRYGGYRLAPGHRLPPLMLSDDEALAVLLGLAVARRSGPAATAVTAGETAAAKIRRVLPERVARRLDTVLGSLAFTAPPGEFAVPDPSVLLTLADAVRHGRPVSVKYTDRNGRRSDRTLHPYGLVAHSGRWYVTGADPGIGEDRTFRLDGITDARTLPGSFEAPAGPDPAQRVLTGFATAAYRHEVTLRIHGTPEQIRARFPAALANLEELDAAPDADLTPEPDPVPDSASGPVPLPEPDPLAGPPSRPGLSSGSGPPSGSGPDAAPSAARWFRVALRVERLDWLPGLLASLDRPFVIERPGELRDLVAALADRLAHHARRT
ncbi:helix-turn-helix transcriptional regulator [Streptomyces sp. NRRL S-340]|uniref:helix-turn-helix transcriptional regulator n=1 Tax=Streptomyces sp. NRRL S-340 TaxID=1463901 RepID=UPI00055C30A9|nr:YafY family protein [Streptomyces sp. NRRL S-340]